MTDLSQKEAIMKEATFMTLPTKIMSNIFYSAGVTLQHETKLMWRIAEPA
jgi:hypothetical protein